MATYGGRSHGAHLTSDLGGLERELSSRLELEHTVLEQRAQELRRESRKQARQRAFLREERKRAREDRERIDKDEERLKHREKDDWFPKDYLERVPTRRLRVNVGGQIFEVGCDKLGADPDSLLAALAADDCPLFKGAAGGSKVAYVDRDWWTFRHVLAFLRDGVLPASPSLALPLYREAAFWRLDSLKRAVEETHLHLTRTAAERGTMLAARPRSQKRDTPPRSRRYGHHRRRRRQARGEKIR